MITGLAHVCLQVRDLEAATRFYCDGLGLREAFDFRRADGARFGVYLHLGRRTFLELFENPDLQSGPGAYQHLCLEVEDMGATVADLRRRGVEVGEIALGSDGSYQAWLADPEGNRVELHQYTPESQQANFLDSV